VAHIKGKSFNCEGKELLFSTVDPKTKAELSDDEVARRFRAGSLKPMGVFRSPEAATRASKMISDRSKSNRPLNPSSSFLGKDIQQGFRRIP